MWRERLNLSEELLASPRFVVEGAEQVGKVSGSDTSMASEFNKIIIPVRNSCTGMGRAQKQQTAVPQVESVVLLWELI